MPDTLGSLKAEVLDWISEPLPDSRVNAAINDATENLFLTLFRAHISLFLGGPTSIDLSAGTEGIILVSVVDPTTAPTVDDTAAAAADLASHSIRAAVTYVTESGSETLPSPTTTHITTTGMLAAVHPPPILNNVIGWNCYASSSAAGRLVKQNDAPLGFADNFQEPEAGFAADPNGAFPPVINTTGDDICFIKHMEAPAPNGGYMSYDGADIDSLLMRRMGRSVASSSPFQNYYYDLIDQRQLEFRPALGASFSPRYFYVKRPRRLRFDNAPLPFLTVPSTGFLRYFALGLLCLSIREFQSSVAWDAKAERERTRLELAVVQMNQNRNQWITAAW